MDRTCIVPPHRTNQDGIIVLAPLIINIIVCGKSERVLQCCSEEQAYDIMIRRTALQYTSSRLTAADGVLGLARVRKGLYSRVAHASDSVACGHRIVAE